MPGRMNQLAEYVVSTTLADIPPDVSTRAKMIVLDNLGSAMVGSELPGSDILAKTTPFVGAGDEATISLGTHRGTTSFSAALVNSAYINVSELGEAVTRAQMHPGTFLVPAALAEGERLHSSGRDLLVAMTVSFDVLVRVGWALNHIPGEPLQKVTPQSFYKGWFSPSIVAAFGTAAVTAKLNNLPVAAVVESFGICGNVCPTTLLEGFLQGVHAKAFGCGWATAAGMYSAHLAGAGFTGIKDIEEHLLHHFVDQPDYERITDQLGVRYELREVGLKPFAIGPMASDVECALTIMERHRLDPAHVKTIKVETNTRASRTALPEPRNVLSAKFSLPYCIAQVFLGRTQQEMMLEAFQDQAFSDPRWPALARLVMIEVNPEFDRAFESYPPRARPSRITVGMDDGTSYQVKVEEDRWAPANPATEADYIEKFRYVAGHYLGSDRVNTIVDLVTHLESVADVAELGHAISR